MAGTEEKPLYDLEKVYDEQISPLMTQIIAICKEHRLPMLMTFQYQRDAEQGEGLCTTNLPFEDRVPCEAMVEAYRVLLRRPKMSGMKLTTVKADGSKEVEHIVFIE